MSLQDAMKRVRTYELERFIAPIPEGSIVKVLSIQNDIPFWFDRIYYPYLKQQPVAGWWLIEPIGQGEANVKDSASPMDYVDYLDQLPRFTVIYLFSTGLQSGMVVPFNDGDADQRGWKRGEPRIMHLTRGENLIPLTVIHARDLAGTLLYDCQALGHPASSWLSAKFMQWVNNHETLIGEDDFPGNFRNAFTLAYDEATQRVKKLYKQNIDTQMEHKLGAFGAELVSWSPRDGSSDYNVRWSFGGETHSMTVTKELRIKSAGICLAGGDQHQDLASIVPVMKMRRERW